MDVVHVEWFLSKILAGFGVNVGGCGCRRGKWLLGCLLEVDAADGLKG